MDDLNELNFLVWHLSPFFLFFFVILRDLFDGPDVCRFIVCVL